MLPNKLAFVDIETTGMRSFYDRIIEIAVLRVEDNQITSTFHSLINPEGYLPPEITMLTGITAGDLENAPTFNHIKKDILEILSGCVFVAHNVRFDYGFLKNEFRRVDISFSTKHFCTVRLSRALYPQFSHHNLDSLIERFGFTCPSRHRALDDAKILVNFYNKIIQDFPSEKIEKAVRKALKRPSIPIKLQTDLEALPEGPGVYIFYGKSEYQNPKSQTNSNTQNTKSQTKKFQTFKNSNLDNSFDIRASNFELKESFPLYIGKSKNLRERILSHFSSDIRSPLEMKISQQIVSIETVSTAGELGALFLESQMIKKMLPFYNKKSRIKRELTVLRKITTKDGYDTVKMEITNNETFEQLNNEYLDSIVGLFKSRKQAKSFLSDIAKKYGLCEKLLFLEKTNKACFAHRLQRCKGACIGIEKPISYNMRYITAFSSSKIKPWPFQGTIIIEESDSNKKEYFLINKWCYIGNIKIDSEGNKNAIMLEKYTFDLDIYNILKQFLSNSQNYKKVRLLNDETINCRIISNC